MAIPTNKSQLAEQVLRALAEGDPSSDFPIKLTEVILMLPSVAHGIIADEMNSGMLDTRWLTDFEDVPILTDTAKKLKYSDIPANYISLPDGMGLYHISTMLDQEAKFKMVQPTFNAMYKGMEAKNLYGYVGYWVEGQRIYYTSQFTGLGYACEAVLIKLVCSFDGYGDYDTIFIDEAIKFKIINTLVSFYNGELAKYKDSVNDNRYIPSNQPQ